MGLKRLTTARSRTKAKDKSGKKEKAILDRIEALERKVVKLQGDKGTSIEEK